MYMCMHICICVNIYTYIYIYICGSVRLMSLAFSRKLLVANKVLRATTRIPIHVKQVYSYRGGCVLRFYPCWSEVVAVVNWVHLQKNTTVRGPFKTWVGPGTYLWYHLGTRGTVGFFLGTVFLICTRSPLDTQNLYI